MTGEKRMAYIDFYLVPVSRDNKAAPDAGMTQVTGDRRMQFQDRPPVFDGRRLIPGGFEPMLEEPRHDQS